MFQEQQLYNKLKKELEEVKNKERLEWKKQRPCSCKGNGLDDHYFIQGHYLDHSNEYKALLQLKQDIEKRKKQSQIDSLKRQRERIETYNKWKQTPQGKKESLKELCVRFIPPVAYLFWFVLPLFI